MGMIERESRLFRLYIVKDRSASTLGKIIEENVSINSKRVFTDGWKGYSPLNLMGYRH